MSRLVEQIKQAVAAFVGCKTKPALIGGSALGEMNRPDRINEIFAGAGVVDVTQSGLSDLSDWVELMEAVEALCPVWPAQHSHTGTEYRL
ncbi:MAG: hypothetical protein ABI870_13775 [Rhodanobacter sp.]